jgi:predicted O-methyltransferase YrrM
MIARAIGAKKTLDIGVFTGYSSLAMALALGPGARVIALESDESFAQTAQRHWTKAAIEANGTGFVGQATCDGVGGATDVQVHSNFSVPELHLRPAKETLKALCAKPEERETFDFAFIDADKANTNTYFEACLKLLRPGGILAVDNMLWQGRVLAAEAERDEHGEKGAPWQPGQKKAVNTMTKRIHELNRRIAREPRVESVLLPVGDGVQLARKR